MIYNQVNPTLRWGFLSATSDFTTLRSWLGLDDSASFVLEPLKHDVTIVYQEKAEWNYVNWVLRSIIDYTKTHPVGHIMVFAPGKREVDTIAEAIRKNPAITNKKVYAVYADQDESSRNSVIESVPEGTRKIAVGTNVLETSITIPGLQLVIDTCYQKTASFNPVAIHRRLMLCLVSAAQADQRAGRTGRVGAGIVMRGCTEQYFEDVIKKHRYPAPKISAQEYTSALLSNLALVDRLNLATDGKFGDLKTIDTPSESTDRLLSASPGLRLTRRSAAVHASGDRHQQPPSDGGGRVHATMHADHRGGAKHECILDRTSRKPGLHHVFGN